MAPVFAVGVLVLALGNGAMALPAMLLGTERMAPARVAQLASEVDRRVLERVRAAYECLGQSCLIADTSGASGRDPTMKPEGADDSDVACVLKYSPRIAELMKQYNNQIPEVPKQNTTWVTTAMMGLNQFIKPMSNPRITGTFNGTCAENILIYAKGTLEPGLYGITIGPQLTANLPKGWSFAPVDYDADIAGDFCLGLPGGMVAKDTINGANQKCPQANLFISGYSQGAMVIRNGLARATDQAKAKTKVSLPLWPLSRAYHPR